MSEGDAPVGAVTIVFTDIAGSTELWERRETAMSAALRLHDALLRDAIERHGGYEVKAEGDAFMVVFNQPQNAIRFCLDVQERLMATEWPEELSDEPAAAPEPGFRGLRVRMGVHAGAPLARLNPMTGRTDYFGPVVNRAARVCSAAAGGQVLVTGSVWRQAEPHLPDAIPTPFGEHQLKGIAEPVDLVQVLSPPLRARQLPEPQGEAGDLTESVRVLGFLKRTGGDRYAFPIMRRRCTIGRSSSCDLVLVEDGVSKVHCVLRVDPARGFVIRDEGSTNGTYVNGTQVTEMRLADGDRLRVGSVEFKVQVGRTREQRASQADEMHTVATRILDAKEIHGPSRWPWIVGGLVVATLLLCAAGAVLVALFSQT